MQSATLIVACGTIAKFVADKWIDVQFARHARLALPLHSRQSDRPASLVSLNMTTVVARRPC